MSYLTAENITHAFKNIQVLDHFSLSSEKGECVSLMGPSGCGKTTFLRILAGLLKPDEGRILLDGQDITEALPDRRQMAMVFQTPALFPHTRIRDNIAYGLHKLGWSKEEIQRQVNETGAMLKIADQLGKYPGALSGGQQQRAGIARALIRRPSILLLDEPFSSLDAPLKFELIEEIRQIQRQNHMTMIYVTHDEREAQAASDRIVIMNRKG